ncbi:cytochrome P450 20A1-like [Ptychodera flava]|uniref:cytochrome P450 20A1-like n=1 Tax=Ptychodera flava TaxID=63121 RepID=UPI00396A57B5
MAYVAVFLAIVVVVLSILYQCLQSRFNSNHSKDSGNVRTQGKPRTSAKIPGMEKRNQDKGNLEDIMDAGGFQKFIFKLHAEYGDIASFWYGKHYYVSLASPEAWKDHIKAFDKPDDLYEFSKPLIGAKNIQFANGEDAKRRRKLYDVSFQYEAVARYHKCYQEMADEVAEKISSLPAGEHIAVKECMSWFVSHAYRRVVFGDTFDDETKVVALHDHYVTTMDALNQKIGNPGLETDEKFDRALKVWHDLMRDIVQHRRDNPPLSYEDRNFLDILIDSCENEEQLLSEVLVYYSGGYHTTTFMLVWALYYLSQDMTLQDKVHEEVIEVLGKESNRDYWTYAKLGYGKRVLDESIRCSVLAPFTARINYDEDMEVLGYRIEKGAGVVHALGVVHMDENIWPEPERFDPDRFLPEQVAKRHTLAFSPFGFAGKRICPGYRLSYATSIVLLATLCERFKFSYVGSKNVRKKYGIVTLPSEEVWVTAEKREQ